MNIGSNDRIDDRIEEIVEIGGAQINLVRGGTGDPLLMLLSGLEVSYLLGPGSIELFNSTEGGGSVSATFTVGAQRPGNIDPIQKETPDAWLARR